jgi:hypothetical protein
VTDRETCELCGAEHPTWFYPTKDVEHRVQVTQGLVVTVRSWIVCEHCRTLAVHGDWKALLDRQVEGLARLAGGSGLSGEYPAIGEVIRRAAATIQALFRTAIVGLDPRARARPPRVPGIGGDLDAFRTGWIEVWRAAPGHLIGDADGRATELLEAFRSWGIDPGHPQVLRCLWGILAVAQHDRVDPELVAALSAVLSSLEVGT